MVLSGRGIVAAGAPAGLYKVRVQFGRDISGDIDRVIVLDRNDARAITTRPLPASAPIAGSAVPRDVLLSTFESAMVAPVQTGLSIVARYWTDEAFRTKPGVTFPNPFEGLEIVYADGAPVAGLLESADLTHVSEPDPVLVATLAVAPGTYFLRQTLPDGRIVSGASAGDGGPGDPGPGR